MRTFTVGFADARYDERAYARLVATRYGTVHEELEIEEDVAATLPRLAATYDEPLGDEAAFPTFLIAEQARRHVTVALAGDGGDESFAGYERYAALALAGRIPSPVAKAGASAAARSAGGAAGASLAALPCRALSRRGCDAGAGALRAADGGLPAGGATSALGRSRRGTPDGAHADAVPASPACSSSTSRPISRAISCSKADLASMAHSLELRSPFLDHEVVALGLALPDSLKVRGREGKVALRRAFADLTCRPRSTARGKTRLRRAARPLVSLRSARARTRPAPERPRLVPARGRSAPARRARIGPRRSWAPALVPADARAVGARARRGTGSRTGSVKRPYLWLIAAAAIVPRVSCSCTSAVGSLTAFTDKSDDFAQTFVHHGTFGFIPGEPSAYTQPLYGFFLVPIYWIFGRTLVGGRRRADRRGDDHRVPRLRDRRPGHVAARGHDRRRSRNAQSVSRLARRAPEPRGARPARRGGTHPLHADRGRPAFHSLGDRRRDLRRAGDPRQRAADPHPGRRAPSTCSFARAAAEIGSRLWR